MGRLRKEAETILDHRYARRTKKSRRTARTWWQKFCAITKLPAVLDLDFRWKTNILLARDVIGNFLQFVWENQRYHDRERECGHHETPQRYCAPVLSDLQEGGWVLLTTANLKQSPLQDKWGGFPTPFRIGPEMKGLTLAPGTWLAMKELYNPVTDSLRRARLPLFMHPRKSQ